MSAILIRKLQACEMSIILLKSSPILQKVLVFNPQDDADYTISMIRRYWKHQA